MNNIEFAWYSKFVEGNADLKVIFHIKDEQGLIFNPYLTPLDINNELVYTDGYVTLFMPLYLLKEKPPRASKNSTVWLAATALLVCILYLL